MITDDQRLKEIGQLRDILTAVTTGFIRSHNDVLKLLMDKMEKARIDNLPNVSLSPTEVTTIMTVLQGAYQNATSYLQSIERYIPQGTEKSELIL